MGESLKTINIAMSVDAKGVSTGMKDAADAIKAGTDKIQTATETIATNTKKADESMRTLAQSYRSAFKDAQRIAESQGMQSQAFKEAAAKAGEYRNKLDDVKQVTQILSSDTPLLKGMSDVTKGLAGSVGAVSGAMAAFAGNNKTLQEWAQRSQGAISMLMGLEALGGLPDALKAMGVAINSVAVPALMKLWALAAANPITAIVSVLGAAAAAFGIYTLATEDSVEATKKVAKPTQDASKSIEKLTADLKEHNEALRIQLAAKKAGIQIDAFKAKQVDEEIKQKQELVSRTQKEIDNLKVTDAITAATLVGKRNLIKTTNDEITSLQAYQKALQDSAALQDKLDAKTSKKENIKTKTIKFQSITDGLGLNYIETAANKAKEAMASLPDHIDMVQDKFSSARDKIKDVSADLINALKDLARKGFVQFSTMAGEALAGAKVDWGKSIWALVAQVAATFADAILTMGTINLFIPGMEAVGALQIAGAAALYALSGYIGYATTDHSSASISDNGAVSSMGSSIAPAPNVNNMYLSGVLYGNDILISTKKSQQQYNRIK